MTQHGLVVATKDPVILSEAKNLLLWQEAAQQKQILRFAQDDNGLICGKRPRYAQNANATGTAMLSREGACNTPVEGPFAMSRRVYPAAL
ncbi:MAG: hypothetical protein ACRD2G_05960 [Terriglobia bacterium]